jgi:hypothetical protein
MGDAMLERMASLIAVAAAACSLPLNAVSGPARPGGGSLAVDGRLRVALYASGRCVVRTEWSLKAYLSPPRWLLTMRMNRAGAGPHHSDIYTACFDGVRYLSLTTEFEPTLSTASKNIQALGGVAVGHVPTHPRVFGSTFMCFALDPNAWAKAAERRTAPCIWDSGAMLDHGVGLPAVSGSTVLPGGVDREIVWHNPGTVRWEDDFGRLQTKRLPGRCRTGFINADYSCRLTNSGGLLLPLTATLRVFGPDLGAGARVAPTSLRAEYDLQLTNFFPAWPPGGFRPVIRGRTLIYDERLPATGRDIPCYIATKRGPWHPQPLTELLAPLARARSAIARHRDALMRSDPRHLSRAALQIWAVAGFCALLTAFLALARPQTGGHQARPPAPDLPAGPAVHDRRGRRSVAQPPHRSWRLR